MRTHGLIILALVALLTARVNAQSLSIGPQFGYQKSQDADDGKLMVGAAARLRLSPALGGEASINYREESYSNGAMTVKTWPVMLTGLIYPFPVVYGAIGAGWYNTSVDYDVVKLPRASLASETEQRFGWHFGGGLDIPASTSLRVTTDIRYVFLDYNFTAVPGTSGVNSNFYVVTLGLLFDL